MRAAPSHPCIKWPAADKVWADAYNAECAVRYENLTSKENAVWAVVREDAHGNWAVPLLGAPGFYSIVGDFEEPASCLGLRTEAVVVATPEWPVAEDE